jgi:ribonuclease HI
MSERVKLQVYTDGASSPNGNGGYAGIIIHNDKIVKKVCGSEDTTTNNRMEMKAVIQTIRVIKEPIYDIEVFTDSQYVQKGIEEWIHNWKRNGWVTKEWKTNVSKPVKNKDLWIELDNFNTLHNIKWNWVRGHNGNHYNEIVDKLAVKSKEVLKD